MQAGESPKPPERVRNPTGHRAQPHYGPEVSAPPGRRQEGMQTDFATLSKTANALKNEREQKQKAYREACRSGDPLIALAARADAIRADKKYQQAVRVAIGGIKRIGRRGPDPTNQR